MRAIDIERTAYPQFKGDITDRELKERYTLEPAELSLVRDYRGDQLSLAIRLKLFQHLLNHDFSLDDVPQKVVDYIVSQLQIQPSHSLLETRGSRYEHTVIIRRYTGFSPFSATEQENIGMWLLEAAEKQSHLIDLVNEAIFHLEEIRIELPAFQHLVRLAASALHEADKRQSELLDRTMSAELKCELDALLQSENRYQRTPFYELKEPPETPSANAIIKEVQLLQRLRSFNISFDVLEQINNDKLKHFSEIAKSYKSNELYNLVPETRYPILLCFICTRIKEVTDNIVELLFRLWNKITRNAERVQDEYVLRRDEFERESGDLSEQFLEIIVESSSRDEIVDRIFELHSYEEYKSLLGMVRRFKKPKKEKYFEALSGQYSYVRRFMPMIWENLTFRSNTSDDTLIQAVEYLKENLDPSVPELPVRGAPVDFVPDDWDRHVFTRQRSTRKVISVNKSMYELCVIDRLIDKIIAGEVYVVDSQYYSSLEEYLIPLDEFLSKREYYIQKLKLPETAEEFVGQLAGELEELLDYMDRNYEILKPYTKISRGSLSFSRVRKEEEPPGVEELTDLITSYMKPVSIIDIIIDVDKLTGFLDMFETVGYKEGMTRAEKAERIAATLLCYGCNIGPQQTERSTDVNASSILYMRRRYCSEESLLKVIGYLSDCQHKTWLAWAYGDGTGFITDGTMYSAPRRSMHTEPHFRYSKGHGIIAYPLLSDQYVALITQAIICSQYEAIQMFEAFSKQKSHFPLLKNFSDSHGQSLLAFAFSRLLHIDLLPRLRTRKHKMLYKASKEADYKNLNDAIHGVVRWEYPRKYYDDMLRILASFLERKASPAHILLKIAAFRNTNSLKIASLEMGKACRSIFLLRISISMALRAEIQREFLKVERWHKFEDEIFIGHGGKLQEDSLEEQYRTLLMLNVILNCIAFWNTLAIQHIVEKLRAEGHEVDQEELKHVTPTMTEHIDLIGKFEINLGRSVPFRFAIKEEKLPS
jgi:TnpA family transposase